MSTPMPRFPSLSEWLCMSEQRQDEVTAQYYRDCAEYGRRALEQLNALYGPADQPGGSHAR